ncbi:cytochrome b [Spongorhabdus nitratireducens]
MTTTEAFSEKYPFMIRILHWCMAAGFLLMWLSGYVMTKSSIVGEDTPLEDILFGLHISAGVTLLFLLIVRVIIRLSSEIPVLPSWMPKWEKVGSHAGHFALYLLPLAVIAIGWAGGNWGGHDIHWFGITMPKLFPTMNILWGINLDEFAEETHELLAWSMLFVTAVHIAAVAKHRWLDKHDVMHRMNFARNGARQK